MQTTVSLVAWKDKISKLILVDQMAAGVIRPSWTSEERASYGAGTTGDSLMELVSAVANEELPDPRKEFLSLGKRV